MRQRKLAVEEFGDGLGSVGERGNKRSGSTSADPIYARDGSGRFNQGSMALLGDEARYRAGGLHPGPPGRSWPLRQLDETAARKVLDSVGVEPTDAGDAPSPPGDNDLSPLLDLLEIGAEPVAELPDPTSFFRPRNAIA